MTNTQNTLHYSREISEYQIGTILGSGSYGSVFQATHNSGIQVAIKILDIKTLEQNKEDYAMIESEIPLLKKLYHKNIVRLLEHFQDSNYIYIVTELCDEGELYDYILQNKKLSEAEALRIFQELIDALVYLNCMDMCHRDIKPDNILLTNGGKVKLIDFGFGIQYDKDHMILKESLGTVPYSCPEIIQKSEYFGALADIWSAGVVLFVMVCGYFPFGEEGDDEDEIASKILKGEYDLLKTISPLLRDLIKNLLELDPCKRFDYEQITNHPWFTSNNPALAGGINLDIIPFPIDDDILDSCSEYDLDKNKVKKDLLMNQFNRNTAIYKLMVQLMIMNDMPTKSDLFSEQYKSYILDDKNYKAVEKSPSGKIITELFRISHFSQEYHSERRLVCCECGKNKSNLMIESTNCTSRKNDCISIISGNTFSLLSDQKGKKECQMEEDKVIQLIVIDNDDPENSNSSIVIESSYMNLITSDGDSQFKTTTNAKEIIPNTSKLNSLTKLKSSCLKRTDNYLSIETSSPKKSNFKSPIREKKHFVSKKIMVQMKDNLIEANSPERKKKRVEFFSINKESNNTYSNKDDSLFKFGSPLKEIRKTKTAKAPLYQIKEERQKTQRAHSFDTKKKTIPISVPRFSHSSQFGKISHETRKIMDNNEANEICQKFISKVDQINKFNRQAKELKAQIAPNQLIRIKSMYHPQIQAPNRKLDKETSEKLLKKFASKSKMQQIKESKSRFAYTLQNDKKNE